MADIVQANYEMLETVSSKFTAQADSAQQMAQDVRACMDSLQGQWIGKGSDAFFNEMGDLVLPGCDRLIQALQEASNRVKQISELMKNAEQEASGGFRVTI